MTRTTQFLEGEQPTLGGKEAKNTMKISSLTIWALGVALAWSIPVVIAGAVGIVLGGAIGGALAGIGVQLALPSKSNTTSTRPTLGLGVVTWVLATIVGQLLLRNVAAPLGTGGLGGILWAVGAAVALGISGAVGGLGTSYMAGLEVKASLRTLLVWSVAMFVGGVFGGILAWFHQPILIGMFGYSSSGEIFLMRAAIGFFAAGAVAGLIAGIIALPRVSIPVQPS